MNNCRTLKQLKEDWEFNLEWLRAKKPYGMPTIVEFPHKLDEYIIE